MCTPTSVRPCLSACPIGRLKVYQARVPVCDSGERDPRQQRTAAAYNVAFNSLTERCTRCALGEAPSARRGPHFEIPPIAPESGLGASATHVAIPNAQCSTGG